MARPLRIEHEAAVYHVLSRGNRSEYIFEEDTDKEYFLTILERATSKFGIEIFAYCIMGNHYHLLIGAPYGMLSRVMHTIQSAYGSYQRQHRERIGHIFAGRFKSICVEKEGYLIELSRYIHLNPVRASIVKTPEEYRWSSYRYYTGDEKSPEWLNTSWLLQEYGEGYQLAAKKYRAFVEAGIGVSMAFENRPIVGQAIIGSKDFIEKTLNEIRERPKPEEVISRKIYQKTLDMEKLHSAVSNFYQVDTFAKSRRECNGRDMFIYLAKNETTSLNGEIGALVGGISSSAITQRYARTVRRLAQDEKAMTQWKIEAVAILSIVRG
jgi:REP element-mobilizing transposase RayT